MEEIKKIEIESTEPVIEKQEVKKRGRKKWLLVLLVPLFLLITLGVAIAIPVYAITNKSRVVIAEAQQLKAATQTKDLKVIAERMTATRKALRDLDDSVNALSWLGSFPLVGPYQKDAVHFVKAGEAGLEVGDIVLTAIAPYADILGFTGGAQAQTGEKTAQDRITFLVTTLDKVTPQIDKIGEKTLLIKQEISQIDPYRYPETFRGKKIREPLMEGIRLVEEVSSLTNDAKPLLLHSPWLLGNDAPRRYLLLFQNDGELRPTGGFITAYAIMEVDKGKIRSVLSDDIYSLDGQYKPTQPAPEVLVKYVPLPYGKDSRWRLRDMNLSPDFASSMKTFLPEFQKTSKLEFDGVITVDTQVLIRLLEVIGPIGVPGWGNFSAKPDDRCEGCANVVYELERIITKPLNRVVTERKAVLGPLMHSILANALGSPKEKVPTLFDAALTSAIQKHVVFYFPDEKIQAAVESFNIAGRIKDFEGDYVHINDSNFAGAKVNIFVRERVEQKVEVATDGTVTENLTIQYKNPAQPSDCNLESGGLCLNAPYRDWVRIYVPKGAKLLETTGLETEVKTYEELGKTVFEGFFGDKYPLRPLGQAKISFKYQLPSKFQGNYKLLIQKQPGVKSYEYLLQVNGQEEEFELKTDREVKLKI